MKTTYAEFLTINPNWTVLTADKDAEAVFDFLSRNAIIVAMADAVEKGEPALAGCVEDLETYCCETMRFTTFNIADDRFSRTVIGRMIKAILAPYGYQPTVEKPLPADCGSQYFKQAHCYGRTPGKASYIDFLRNNPNCSGLASGMNAEAVFDFLSRDASIIAMIDAAEKGEPALAGCVSELEAFCGNMNSAEFCLQDRFTRSVVGRMIKAVLAPFGYQPTVQKALPRGCGSNCFRSASCYELSAAPIMRVVKRIELIARENS